MLLCDEVLQGSPAGKLTVVGLTSTINWPVGATASLRLDRLVILLILTDGRGKGRSQIVC
jgi:hypothetical protein